MIAMLTPIVCELVICAPVEAELWFGASKSSRIDENRQLLKTLLDWLPSLPFTSEAARLSGEIRADLARKGTPIGPYDVQIAAIALANDCVLVRITRVSFCGLRG